MTPDAKMKMKNNAQERSLQFKGNESDFIVEGYAARFEPYVLYHDDNGEEIYEQFDPNCFKNADLSDVILQYDHNGRVFARTSNETLKIEVDEVGLHILADLGKTEAARQLYEDIKAGMVTKMSWRFSVGEYEYRKDTKTIYHKSVGKVYDVSAVSIPANDSTEINARSFADGVICEAARSDAELDERRRKLLLKIKLGVTK